MSVNNGRRVAVVMPGFSGQAGLVEQQNRDVVSFPWGQRPAPSIVGAEISVDGRLRIVLSVSSSPFLRSFKVLELKK